MKRAAMNMKNNLEIEKMEDMKNQSRIILKLRKKNVFYDGLID